MVPLFDFCEVVSTGARSLLGPGYSLVHHIDVLALAKEELGLRRLSLHEGFLSVVSHRRYQL